LKLYVQTVTEFFFSPSAIRHFSLSKTFRSHVVAGPAELYARHNKIVVAAAVAAVASGKTELRPCHP